MGRIAADKNADENEGDGLGMGEEEDAEQEEVEQSAVTFGEHAFQFEKFEQVRTTVAFLPRTLRSYGLSLRSASPTNPSSRPA